MEFRDSLWRKSSYSTDQANCVELFHTAREPRAGIRDSKNPTGGHLTVTPVALHDLLHTVTR